MDSYIHWFYLQNRIGILNFKISPYVSIKTSQKKKRGGEKGDVFLTLVKTIQCWHASLTVCIQDKSAF